MRIINARKIEKDRANPLVAQIANARPTRCPKVFEASTVENLEDILHFQCIRQTRAQSRRRLRTEDQNINPDFQQKLQQLPRLFSIAMSRQNEIRESPASGGTDDTEYPKITFSVPNGNQLRKFSTA